jgi:hypothetical protein
VKFQIGYEFVNSLARYQGRRLIEPLDMIVQLCFPRRTAGTERRCQDYQLSGIHQVLDGELMRLTRLSVPAGALADAVSNKNKPVL